MSWKRTARFGWQFSAENDECALYVVLNGNQAALGVIISAATDGSFSMLFGLGFIYVSFFLHPSHD